MKPYLLILCLLSVIIDTKLTYLIVFIVLLFNAPKVLIKARKGSFHNKEAVFVFFLPFLVFLSWLYGGLVGLLNGNEPAYVLSNFFGLAVYLLFYTFWVASYKEQDLSEVYNWLSLLVVVLILFNVYLFFAKGFTVGEGDSLSSGRIYMTSTMMYLYVPIALILFKVRYGYSYIKGSNTKLVFYFSIISFCFIVPALSKGFILLYAVALLAFLSSFYFRKVGVSGVLFNVSLLFMIFMCVFSFFQSQYLEVLQATFGSSNASNNLRNEQFHYLVNELTIHGSGLGATLESGYKRDETGYGFELTYINLVHKLGVFALFIFLTQFYTVLKGVQYLFSGDKLFGVLVLSAMAYLIPGAANPMLLSPNFVAIHCLVLALIFNRVNKKPLIGR
ncbi:hypothetical protein NM528_14450 [Shewanella algae]|uniref:hypothetical protein n=1 Tax=Shewanella algae TaxID=38313 RepID=UPI00315D76B5